MMGLVIPVDVVLTPTLGMTVILKTPWVVRLIFERFELRFTHGIVVTYPRPAVAGGNREFGQ